MLELCLEEVKEQIKTRLDEIGEHNENISIYRFVSFFFVRLRAFHFLLRVFLCELYFISTVCVPLLYDIVLKYVRFIFDMRVCVCVFVMCVSTFVLTCVCRTSLFFSNDLHFIIE